jgi:hypothetical protein
MIELVSLAVMGLMGLFALVRPAWGFAFVLSMFGIEQLLQACHPIFIDQKTLTNVGIGLLAVWTIAYMGISGQLTTRRMLNVTFNLTLALYAFASLSQLWSPSPLLPFLVTDALPYNILSFILAPLMISRMKDLQAGLAAFLIVGSIVCALIVINPRFTWWGGRYILYLDATTKSNPLATGTLGGMVMIVSVLLIQPNMTRAFQAIRAVAFIAGVSMGMMSGSRGQVMFALPILFILYPLARRVTNFANFAQTSAAVAVVAVVFYVASGFFVVHENENRWNAEALIYGGDGRLQNVIDLFNAYMARPAFWLVGLGSDAFLYYPNQTGDIYSHVMLADLLFELGVIGFVIGMTLFLCTATAGKRLVMLVYEDDVMRPAAITLVALTIYHFMLLQKQGQIWGAFPFFMFCIILTRLERLTQEEAAEQSALAQHYDADSSDEASDDASPDPRGTGEGGAYPDDRRALPASV